MPVQSDARNTTPFPKKPQIEQARGRSFAVIPPAPFLFDRFFFMLHPSATGSFRRTALIPTWYIWDADVLQRSTRSYRGERVKQIPNPDSWVATPEKFETTPAPKLQAKQKQLTR